ncbi:EscU/YscU/HrcU family type III secretion system export apparatus switch protein [Mesorhizobium sp.]|nr:EscU/YscU/HrcU family type III secretion system export apparatus switch protein [Mesorhizobium sp.]
MRVAPNFTRLDPIKGLKRFFEIKALSELLKSLIRWRSSAAAGS